MSDQGNLPARAITRREMELVIRRAVELATEQSDAGEAISEDELVRIGQEVGLPPQFVRQALFDLPSLRREAEPTTAAKVMGAATVVAQRIVPGDPEALLRRVDQYLTTHEFLQRRRMQPGQALFEPADDVFSKVVRGFTRSGNRFQLAKASRVGVLALPAEDGRARLRLELDLERVRQDTFVAGGVLGTTGGVFAGTGIGAIGAFAGLALLGPVGAAVGGALLGIGGLVGTIALSMRIARRKFGRTLAEAHAEVDGFLDKVQAGERLEPPPSPVMRKLRDKFMNGLPPIR